MGGVPGRRRLGIGRDPARLRGCVHFFHSLHVGVKLKRNILSIIVVFADPPPTLIDTLSTQTDALTLQPDIADIPDPTTLLDWAVLILNTPDPELKVRPSFSPLPVRCYIYIPNRSNAREKQ